MACKRLTPFLRPGLEMRALPPPLRPVVPSFGRQPVLLAARLSVALPHAAGGSRPAARRFHSPKQVRFHGRKKVTCVPNGIGSALCDLGGLNKRAFPAT